MRIFMYSRTVEDARPYNQDPIYARKSQFILQTNEKSKCCCPGKNAEYRKNVSPFALSDGKFLFEGVWTGETNFRIFSQDGSLLFSF